AVAADANRANHHAVAVKRKSAREDGDAVRQVGDDTVALRSGPGCCREGDNGLMAVEPGKFVLLSEKWPRVIGINSGRIILLRKKTDCACGEGNVQPETKEIMSSVKKSRPRLLHSHVPAK